MTTDNNWPDKLYAITRNWGKTDTAGRFMGFSNVDVLHPTAVRKGQITIEYIRADKVKALQLPDEELGQILEALKNGALIIESCADFKSEAAKGIDAAIKLLESRLK